MFQTSPVNDSGSQAPRSFKQETTSVADMTSFLSKWKEEAGGERASTPPSAYTRHFRVGCHAYVKGLFSPSTVVSHCVWRQLV